MSSCSRVDKMFFDARHSNDEKQSSSIVEQNESNSKSSQCYKRGSLHIAVAPVFHLSWFPNIWQNPANIIGLSVSSVRRCRSPAPAMRQPPSTDCSTSPLQHLRLPFLRFCWSYSLEFTAIQLLDQSSFDGLWKPTCLLVVSVSLTMR